MMRYAPCLRAYAALRDIARPFFQRDAAAAAYAADMLQANELLPTLLLAAMLMAIC